MITTTQQQNSNNNSYDDDYCNIRRCHCHGNNNQPATTARTCKWLVVLGGAWRCLVLVWWWPSPRPKRWSTVARGTTNIASSTNLGHSLGVRVEATSEAELCRYMLERNTHTHTHLNSWRPSIKWDLQTCRRHKLFILMLSSRVRTLASRISAFTQNLSIKTFTFR